MAGVYISELNSLYKTSFSVVITIIIPKACEYAVIIHKKNKAPDIENKEAIEPSLLPTSQNMPPSINPTTKIANTLALKKLGCLT